MRWGCVLLRRASGPGARRARARCTRRPTRTPVSIVHPRVPAHTPPDAVHSTHTPHPSSSRPMESPTSPSATAGGTSPRPWSNRGGEAGRDAAGTSDIDARRVSSRLITDGGALDAWCAPITRVGSSSKLRHCDSVTRTRELTRPSSPPSPHVRRLSPVSAPRATLRRRASPARGAATSRAHATAHCETWLERGPACSIRRRCYVTPARRTTRQ